jgi:hypothetical protein
LKQHYNIRYPVKVPGEAQKKMVVSVDWAENDIFFDILTSFPKQLIAPT